LAKGVVGEKRGGGKRRGEKRKDGETSLRGAGFFALWELRGY